MSTATVHQLPSPSRPAVISAELPERRFEMLPVHGDGAPHTPADPRGHGASSSPAGLSELISSIARHGVLQPLLIEETVLDGEVLDRRVVTGSRRLRACRIGGIDAPENPHFQQIPALVCRGPLTPEQRTSWQISENVSREDLPPGRLGAALLTARTDMLIAALTADGHEPELLETEDVLERWRALDSWRIQHAPRITAPWASVLVTLGISFGPRKARLLAAAFAALPPEVSTDMDAHHITLATRTTLVKAAAGQREFAEDIWAAVKQLGRPELLSATSHAIADGKSVRDALAAAADLHDGANEARRLANSRPDVPDLTQLVGDEPAPTRATSGPAQVPAASAEHAAETLRNLLTELENGQSIDRYLAGTLRLLAGKLIRAVTTN